MSLKTTFLTVSISKFDFEVLVSNTLCGRRANTTILKFSPFCNQNGQPFKVVHFHNTKQHSSSKQRFNNSDFR